MSRMFEHSIFNKNISKWSLKLSKFCELYKFGTINNIKINNYNDFKKYHRQMILEKL